MRVGLVTGEFPPMEGGVGAFTGQVARALSAIGHEVHIISSRDARPDGVAHTPAATREPVDLGFARLHPRIGRWRWPSLSTVADLAIRYDLELLNLQYQAAAFNMRSPAINYLPWRVRGILPTVVTFHDLRVPYLFPKAGSLREAAVRSLARQAQGCIATNVADDRVLRSWTDSPVVEIPIGSNIDAYRPNHIEIAEARDKLGLGGDTILLGYFGFLNETKGADTLIDALARLDGRHHLVFIGGQTGASDPDNNQAFLAELRRRIESLGLSSRVHWTGFLAPERVSAYLVAADMMVIPYRDGVSLRRGTLMAVLAHGRPLITTVPVEATPDFQHEQNMWLVTPDDVEGVVSAVTALAGDEAARERLGHGALELARSFSWEAIATRTAAFYADVLAAYRH